MTDQTTPDSPTETIRADQLRPGHTIHMPATGGLETVTAATVTGPYVLITTDGTGPNSAYQWPVGDMVDVVATAPAYDAGDAPTTDAAHTQTAAAELLAHLRAEDRTVEQRAADLEQARADRDRARQQRDSYKGEVAALRDLLTAVRADRNRLRTLLDSTRQVDMATHTRLMAEVLRDVWQIANRLAAHDDTEPAASDIHTAYAPLLAWEDEHQVPHIIDASPADTGDTP